VAAVFLLQRAQGVKSLVLQVLRVAPPAAMDQLSHVQGTARAWCWDHSCMLNLVGFTSPLCECGKMFVEAQGWCCVEVSVP
jgi:hypothetical protein